MPRLKQTAPQRRDADASSSGPLGDGLPGLSVGTSSENRSVGILETTVELADIEEEIEAFEAAHHGANEVIDLICDDSDEEVQVRKPPRKRRKKGPVLGKEFEAFLDKSVGFVQVEREYRSMIGRASIAFFVKLSNL